MIDDLSMAHDNLQRELSDIKRLIGKDKHELIKANIALSKRVQELERQNKRYREAIEIAMQNIKGVNNLGVDFALRVLGEALRNKTSK